MSNRDWIDQKILIVTIDGLPKIKYWDDTTMPVQRRRKYFCPTSDRKTLALNFSYHPFSTFFTRPGTSLPLAGEKVQSLQSVVPVEWTRRCGCGWGSLASAYWPCSLGCYRWWWWEGGGGGGGPLGSSIPSPMMAGEGRGCCGVPSKPSRRSFRISMSPFTPAMKLPPRVLLPVRSIGSALSFSPCPRFNWFFHQTMYSFIFAFMNIFLLGIQFFMNNNKLFARW